MKKKLLFIAVGLVMFSGACKKNNYPSPPTAEAGTTQSIQSPISQVTLVGSGQTSNGSIVGYLWSLVSGPNYPLIQTPAAATTVVSNLVAGNYKFQLRVTDEAGLTGLDTVSVIVTTRPIQTLTLQPANNPTEFTVGSNQGSFTGSNGGYFVSASWTSGGATVNVRQFVKFDYSAIPANANILSAKLSLYANLNPNNGNLVDAHFGSSNELSLQRVTTPWTTSTTWAGQPSSTILNQVIVPQSTSSFQDNVDIEVTQLVKDMFANSNNGFLAKIATEQPFNSRQYYSSFATNASKRPKLVITYN